MANELVIEIGKHYILNGDIFVLEDVSGGYFSLIPVKVNNVYHTGNDGIVLMKAIQFSVAEIYEGKV